MELAERLNRHFCRVGAESAQCWEPPVDILESEDALIIHAALPGVPASAVVVSLDSSGVTLAGVRPFPGPHSASIHRIEIPYGRFERHVCLPMDVLELAGQDLADGCLMLVFRKTED
jgi:HSP20 family molecular chaperone IbpA